MSKFNNKYRVESTRLPHWDYSNPGLYFITICTQSMVEWFGDVVEGKMQLNPIGKIVAEEWVNTPKIRGYIELYDWIVMPNHFHGIIGINPNVETTEPAVSNDNKTIRRIVSKHGEKTKSVTNKTTEPVVSTTLKPDSLGSIIGQFKSVCTKRIRKYHNPKFSWQSRFWDHVIRNEHSFERIIEYIRLNPQNWERDKNNRNSDSEFVKKL
ncbi:MAG: transposase [Candidatus Marinimicrobia bacterium]|nr:transposase [Candidatus Neomarinimicrobiota bacterium]